MGKLGDDGEKEIRRKNGGPGLIFHFSMIQPGPGAGVFLAGWISLLFRLWSQARACSWN